ncbi:MAG TPA: L-2-hydroxyglutarate oxidase [Thermoplasmata archaeon]|nr:L-2-hydroxyglutarate oxidase [Thermoplasmata archaeon]
MADRFDLAIVGGGIVGLATAREIHSRRPDWSLAVLEKEPEVGSHQTGHNSGVVHSGVYYRPGSLKAQLCLEGRASLLEFAEREKIPTRRIGKVIVAVRPEELPVLDSLEARARANGVTSVRRLSGSEVAARLPETRGLGGLDIPSAAIIDYPSVARRLAELLAASGAPVLTGHELVDARPFEGGWRLGAGEEYVARYVVNCAGLECDLVARRMGVDPPIAIFPFRGDFYYLSARMRALVPCLVYPVPDPDLPFLGVHLTPTVDGQLLAGPNAALSLAREGYHPGEWDPRDLLRMAEFRGILGLARGYGSLAAREWLRSWSPAAFLAAIRTLWPSVTPDDLGFRTSGVRAQAVAHDGTLVDDFVFVRAKHALHVLNAPSPAATAAFAIARRIADEAGVPRAG